VRSLPHARLAPSLAGILRITRKPIERTLIEAGSAETVKETRQAFQMALRQAFSEAVEEITGRKVVAFMSQAHFEPDLAAEIFVLEPNTGDGAASA